MDPYRNEVNPYGFPSEDASFKSRFQRLQERDSCGIFFDDPIGYKGLVYLHEFYMHECLILMVFDTCYSI